MCVESSTSSSNASSRRRRGGASRRSRKLWDQATARHLTQQKQCRERGRVPPRLAALVGSKVRMFVPTFVETQRFRTDSRGTLDYILTNSDLREAPVRACLGNGYQ